MAKFEPAGAPGTRRARAYTIIFESEPGWPRAFDMALMVAILASVFVVMLESISELRAEYGAELRVAEWFFTVLFTFEYALRVWSVRPARAYVFSFFGLVDLLAVVPTYLSLIILGGQSLAVVRILRVIRVFRVLKLAQYVTEASVLTSALQASRYKITVFLVTVLTIISVVGSAMYFVEGPASGFTSIPMGMYWAVVTLTTVGYGDIIPVTIVGRVLAAMVMILGYAIIAVPTGIVTAELTAQSRERSGGRACTSCGQRDSDGQGAFCRWCGTSLG